MKYSMYKTISICVVILLLASSTGCANESVDKKMIWDESQVECRITDVLQDDLFLERDAYDSCHYLMIPIRWGFHEDKREVILACEDLFERFLDYGEAGKSFQSLNGLSKNHWYYLISEFLCLCEENGISYDERIAEHIISHIIEYYEIHGGNWAAYTSYDNMYDLFDGLLFGKGYESGNSLNNAITDNELFPLAILCDMNYLTANNSEIKVSDYQKGILSRSQFYADAICKNEVIWNDWGGGSSNRERGMMLMNICMLDTKA